MKSEQLCLLNFSEILRHLRRKAGISQVNLAHFLAVSKSTVYLWEKGHHVPNPNKLLAIAKLLDVDVNIFKEFNKNTIDVNRDKLFLPEMVRHIKSVSFQGLEGAYSHQALCKCFPNAQAIPCYDFDSALDKVRTGFAEASMIPIENSLYGRVSDIHQILPNSSLYIIGEYFLPIHHVLMGTIDSNLSTVNKVISHPQALGQTRSNLRALNIRCENWFDTAGAAKEIARRNDKTIAAIASAMAAKFYNLKILRQNIEDKLVNVTRFIIMSPRRIDPPIIPNNPLKTLTSLVFTTRSIPSALYKCIGGFATQRINIIKLESYVPFLEDKNASFYIEVEGNPCNNDMQQALDELDYYTNSTKILGVYAASVYRDKN